MPLGREGFTVVTGEVELEDDSSQSLEKVDKYKNISSIRYRFTDFLHYIIDQG
jgi:hypothetical protein